MGHISHLIPSRSWLLRCRCGGFGADEASFAMGRDLYRRAQNQVKSPVGRANQAARGQELDRSPVPVPIADFLCRATPSQSQALKQSLALATVETEIPRAMREHLSAGLKTKDPSTSFIAIHDTTGKIRQADGCNVLIEQDVKKLFPRTRFFRVDGGPLTGTCPTVPVGD